nr:tetratricopeptide repeat protein [Alteraurantiacibacter buctensis]
MLAACACLALASAADPLGAAPADDAVAEARAALERGDGVAAEVVGKQALDQGAPRTAVAAYIGEGELLQGDLAEAREWLGEGGFDAASHDRGFVALAKLEIAAGNFAAAEAAFDQVLQHGRPNAATWVEIGRMRYRAGEHHAALAAARQALQLDGESPAALEFMGQLTRDAQGPLASLDLFRRAMRQAPQDMQLAAQYAATLGDAGEHRQMLATVREIVKQSPDIPQAYYLQGILAARAGDDDLARALWWRTEDAFAETAAGMLVAGVLEYRSGNPAAAAESFAKLSRMQPLNITAQLLFARASVANGEANVAVPVLERLAERQDASAYTLVLLARAYEQLDRRGDAAPLLDRAAALPRPASGAIAALWLRDEAGRTRDPADPVQHLRELVNNGRVAEARGLVAGVASQFDGSVDLQLVAGDGALLAGDASAARAEYRQVALIRTNWPLVQRMVAIDLASGNVAAARRLLATYLRTNPRDFAAAAMLGRLERDAGNAAAAAALLGYAASAGSGPSDPLLLGDLATVEQALGRREAALDNARHAARLAPANGRLSALLQRLRGSAAES